jgi:hypothetical protein
MVVVEFMLLQNQIGKVWQQTVMTHDLVSLKMKLLPFHKNQSTKKAFPSKTHGSYEVPSIVIISCVMS